MNRARTLLCSALLVAGALSCTQSLGPADGNRRPTIGPGVNTGGGNGAGNGRAPGRIR
ncbi:MAG: hypothetical protein HY700_16790 [Gemmatimonadetes bacterium]|nr:hypothetical protein [Gemmatimonadota bacterium]